MVYKNKYYDLSLFPKRRGKNRTKSNARRMIAINKTGNRLWRREFDNPVQRQCQSGEATFMGRIVK